MDQSQRLILRINLWEWPSRAPRSVGPRLEGSTCCDGVRLTKRTPESRSRPSSATVCVGLHSVWAGLRGFLDGRATEYGGSHSVLLLFVVSGAALQPTLLGCARLGCLDGFPGRLCSRIRWFCERLPGVWPPLGVFLHGMLDSLAPCVVCVNNFAIPNTLS